MSIDLYDNNRDSVITLLESIAGGEDPMKMLQDHFGTAEELQQFAIQEGILPARATIRRALTSEGARHFAERVIANKILMINQLPPTSEQYSLFILDIAIGIRDSEFQRQVYNDTDERGVFRAKGFTPRLSEMSGFSVIALQALMAILRVEFVTEIHANPIVKERFLQKATEYIKRFRTANPSDRFFIAEILEQLVENEDIVGFYKYVTQDKKALHSWYMEELDLLFEFRAENRGKITKFLHEFLTVLKSSGEHNAIAGFRASCVEQTGVSVKHQRALNAMQNLLIYGHPEITFWNKEES